MRESCPQPAELWVAIFPLPLTDRGKTCTTAIFRNVLVDYKQYGTLVWEEKGSTETILSFLPRDALNLWHG